MELKACSNAATVHERFDHCYGYIIIGVIQTSIDEPARLFHRDIRGFRKRKSESAPFSHCSKETIVDFTPIPTSDISA